MYPQAVKNHQNVNSTSEHRIVSQKTLVATTTTTTATTIATATTTVATMEHVEKKQKPVPITTSAPLSCVAMTTTSNITNVTSVASSSVTMTTASNKKAALQLVSQLEQNILIKQAASSAAQEVITSDVLATVESSGSHDSPSVTHVTRSVSPIPPKQVNITCMSS